MNTFFSKHKLSLSILFIVGLLLFIYFSSRGRSSEFSKYGIEAVGKITAIRGSSKIIVTYIFSDGIKAFEGKDNVYHQFLKTHSEGDTVTIVYSSQNPNHNKIKSKR
jgi:hypothetical protein